MKFLDLCMCQTSIYCKQWPLLHKMFGQLDCSICISIIHVTSKKSLHSMSFYCVLIYQEHTKSPLKHEFYWFLLFYTEQLIVKMSDSLVLSIVSWCFFFLLFDIICIVGIPFKNKKEIPKNLHHAASFMNNFVTHLIICKISLLTRNIGYMCDMTEHAPAKPGEYLRMFPQFSNVN